jgi:hypothetical protein
MLRFIPDFRGFFFAILSWFPLLLTRPTDATVCQSRLAAVDILNTKSGFKILGAGAISVLEIFAEFHWYVFLQIYYQLGKGAKLWSG